MLRFVFTTLALSTLGTVHASAIQDADSGLFGPTPSTLLAEEFIRVARTATMSEPLSMEAINAALTLATEATLLTPDDPSVWRVLHEVAQMADRPAISIYSIKNLLRVAPTQPTAQLARLRDVIQAAQTVDLRMVLYEQLLSESRRQELDARVAARLALDAAYLQRQLGDINQFARWLAEAVALDPAYPDAMNLATGFFGDESADIYRRAELLSSSMFSNIRDLTAQVSLAEFLMAFGDYQDAKELYEIIMGDGASDPTLISDNLLADIVLSQWATGDTVAAMDTLLTRQIAVDETFRKQTQAQQPRLTPLELARIHAPLVPKLAVVRAAVYENHEDSIQADMALEAATGSLLTVSKIYEALGNASTLRVVELYIQAAWVLLWLGDDAESAMTLIQQAETGVTLDPTEKQRLEGWIAFRQGDIDGAIAKLAPLTNDPAAKAGMALVYLAQGNKRDAALELLEIAKRQGGTLLGVWAKHKLQKIVGTTFHIRSEVDELQQLMIGVLQKMNTYVNDPRPPIAIRIQPEKQTFGPYQPLLIDIELTNNTTIPLTIASNGPIQPLLLLEALVEMPGVTKRPAPPVIVSIYRELSILPRGKTSVTVDLRKFWIGSLLNSYPLRGASLTLKATVNFTARKVMMRDGSIVLVYEPGRFGKRNISNIVRVNGVRLNDLWLKQTIEEVGDITNVEQLIALVLLTWVVGDDVSIAVEEPLITPPRGEEPPVLESGERHPLQDTAITTILSTFPKLDSTSQAWVISTMSNDPSIKAVTGMLKEPNSTTAQLAWLIRFATTTVPDEALDDIRLLGALQSENEQVQTVAVWIYKWVQMVVQKRSEQLLGGAS
jgi:tetratricopeptide (TPR) repeat protein